MNIRDVKGFEMDILSRGICECFLPLQITLRGEELVMDYDYTGYHRLRNEELDSVQKVLEVAEKVILALEHGESYYISPGRYQLKPELIYMPAEEQGEGNLKIKYLPLSSEAASDFSREFSGLDLSRRDAGGIIYQMFLSGLRDTTENIYAREYLDMLIHAIKERGLGIKSIKNYIGRLKREAYNSGWEN